MQNKMRQLVAISGLILLGWLLCPQPLFAVTLDLQVGASSNDANQDGAGSMVVTDEEVKIYANSSTTSTDYRYGGFRWTGVTIPPGATITAAYISLYTTGASNNRDLNVDVHFEVADSPVTFSDSNKISSRTSTKTTESVAWVAELVATNWYNSPSLVDVVQEVVDDADWDSGDALVALFIPNTDSLLKYRCSSYDDTDPLYAPKLHIEYTTYDQDSFRGRNDNGDEDEAVMETLDRAGVFSRLDPDCRSEFPGTFSNPGDRR